MAPPKKPSTTGKPSQAPQAAPKQAQGQEQTQAAQRSPVLPLSLNLQYIRDLSFEVPHGAVIFPALSRRPIIGVSMDVNAVPISPKAGIYEVSIALRVEAKEDKSAQAPQQGEAPPKEQSGEARTVFVCDLIYSAVVTLNNPPKELIEPLLLVEVPRLVFPYARNIISDATRDGGFPPVVLQPVDFVSFWQTNKAQRQQRAQQQPQAQQQGQQKKDQPAAEPKKS